MSWWDIIKQPQTLEDWGAEVSTVEPKIQEEQLQTTRPPLSNVGQPTLDVGNVQANVNQPLRDIEGLGQRIKESQFSKPSLQSFEPKTQPQQQQQTETTAADSGDAGSDVGQTIGRIKQHLARNPQGAKGIKTLPIIEKLILASQNPTAYQQEVKDAVKQLKKLVPTAV